MYVRLDRFTGVANSTHAGNGAKDLRTIVKFCIGEVAKSCQTCAKTLYSSSATSRELWAYSSVRESSVFFVFVYI